MIDITPRNSPSESYKNSSTFNNYHQAKTTSGDSPDTGGMDRSHIPTHSAFDNDDFADPEGENKFLFIIQSHFKITFIQIANTSTNINFKSR